MEEQGVGGSMWAGEEGPGRLRGCSQVMSRFLLGRRATLPQLGREKPTQTVAVSASTDYYLCSCHLGD